MPLVNEHNISTLPLIDLGADKRARCVLLVGNGFTKDLLRYFQLDPPDEIATWPLIPPPKWLSEIPIPFSGTGLLKPIWSNDRYPELYEAWLQYASSMPPGKDQFLLFCEKLAQAEAFQGDAESGKMSFTNRSPGVQLRYYLRHLFTQYEDRFFQSNLSRPIEHWPWYLVLKHLAEHYRLTIVSYNYDCFIETILRELGVSYFSPPVFCVQQLNCIAVGEACVLKPHGSISHMFPGMGGSEGAKIHCWLDGDPGGD